MLAAVSMCIAAVGTCIAAVSMCIAAVGACIVAAAFGVLFVCTTRNRTLTLGL